MEIFTTSGGKLIFVLFLLNFKWSFQYIIMTTDELENHISPEDLQEFLKVKMNETAESAENDLDYADIKDNPENLPVPNKVDCFGLGSLSQQIIKLFNMKPDSSDSVNTHYYFSSRAQPNRVQIYPDDQFGLEWVDFKPSRRTVIIVHGFMSHSNASWVIDMTKAFLEWADVNVIAVDWSGGGNTWKYWRAVANTRRVGSDVTGFLRKLIKETGTSIKDLHFVGHSLGAHISSYVSFHLGKVARITGLDPAQPCFSLANSTERLDINDADFVDVIHTNGRLMTRLGFGLPDPIGHADFYPNGGMKQPGCYNDTNSIWYRILPISPTKLQQAICSHGRAYLLFTESLINNNCSFRAFRWNMTYEGVNASMRLTCNRPGLCTEMGIKSAGIDGVPRANGPYFTITTEREPYCPTENQRSNLSPDLLKDLRHGFRLDGSESTTTAVTLAYADPYETYSEAVKEVSSTTLSPFRKWLGDLFG